jgi:hypothetical protein
MVDLGPFRLFEAYKINKDNKLNKIKFVHIRDKKGFKGGKK